MSEQGRGAGEGSGSSEERASLPLKPEEGRGGRYICTFRGRKFSSHIFFLPDESGAQTYDRGEAQKVVAKDCIGCHCPFTSRAAEWLINDPGLLEPYQLQPNPCLPSKTHPVSSG